MIGSQGPFVGGVSLEQADKNAQNTIKERVSLIQLKRIDIQRGWVRISS